MGLHNAARRSVARRVLAAAALAATVGLAACGGPSGGSSQLPVAPDSSQRGVRDVLGGLGLRLTISLYDAPLAAYSDAHVNLAIAGINAIRGGKVTQPVADYASAPLVVDLLALQEQPMSVQGSVAAGNYDAVQLVIDLSKSNVTLGNEQLPLVLGSHKALTLLPVDGHVAFSGAAGQTASVALDFNVLESIKIKNGEAVLNPKVVGVNGNRSASMHGRVVNAQGAAVANAAVQFVATDGTIVNTSVTGKDGHFRVHAIPGGAYRVVVKNAYVTASGESLVASAADASSDPSVSVVVPPGTDLDLGEITD